MGKTNMIYVGCNSIIFLNTGILCCKLQKIFKIYLIKNANFAYVLEVVMLKQYNEYILLSTIGHILEYKKQAIINYLDIWYFQQDWDRYVMPFCSNFVLRPAL